MQKLVPKFGNSVCYLMRNHGPHKDTYARTHTLFIIQIYNNVICTDLWEGINEVKNGYHLRINSQLGDPLADSLTVF